MPIFDVVSDNSGGGTNTYSNSPGHVADLGLPRDAHGLVSVDVFGWCPQEHGALRVCRRYRDLQFSCVGGVTSLESRAPDVDTTDSALSGAVITISAPGGMAMISVDVVGVPGTIIAWEADIQAHGQTPPTSF
jgi:hypothetical protein